MDYSEAYDIIAHKANDLLSMFSDGWSRWPVGDNARMLVNHLLAKVNTNNQFGIDGNKELLSIVEQIREGY